MKGRKGGRKERRDGGSGMMEEGRGHGRGDGRGMEGKERKKE